MTILCSKYLSPLKRLLMMQDQHMSPMKPMHAVCVCTTILLSPSHKNLDLALVQFAIKKCSKLDTVAL